MPRVAVGRISHETNTFSPIPTNFESFAEGRSNVYEGEEILRGFRGSKTGIGGFLEVGEAQGWEMIGTVAADATPSANVAAAAYDRQGIAAGESPGGWKRRRGPVAPTRRHAG